MICSKCGKEIREGAKFCNFCGNQVDEYAMKTKTTPRTPHGKKKVAIIIIAIVVVAFVVVGIMVWNTQHHKCGKNLTWSYNSETATLSISGTGYMDNSRPWKNMVGKIKEIVIADGVASIGSCAFQNCKEVKSITIPDSVTWIEIDAFDGCEGLTSITIPKNVTRIDWCAFSNCPLLTSVSILSVDPLDFRPDSFDFSTVQSIYYPQMTTAGWERTTKVLGIEYYGTVECSDGTYQKANEQ